MAVRRFLYSQHNQWMTLNKIGELKPFFVAEVTPGDTWEGTVGCLHRLAPLDKPAFLALGIHYHFFYVPHRIVWPEFEDVITGVDTTSQWPTITIGVGPSPGLLKSFGLGNSGTPPGYSVNALPIRAFNLVWNEYFRDQKVDAEVALDEVNTIQRVRFASSDYFAGVRTEVQQGPEETVDVSGGTLSVTALRDAIHRQRFRERRSQFGERYYDYLSAMGLRVPSSRLDRPEHVGRGRSVLGVSEVVATATSATENTGAYRGHGISGGNVRLSRRAFVENGTLLGVYFARQRNVLRSRVDPLWLVRGKDDLYQQEMVHDTQVAVRSIELTSEHGNDSDVWAYTRRYEWLRRMRDTIAGGMDDAAYSNWAPSRNFGNVPSVQDVMQVPDPDHLFQDQTAAAPRLFSYFDNRMRKYSIIARAKR